MIDKRRARGEGSISQRKNGLWVASIETGEYDDRGRPKRKQATSMDYNKVLEKLRQLREDIENGRTDLSVNLTVETWLTDWLNNIIKREVKPSTWTGYRSGVNQHLIPALGRKKLLKLTPAEIRTAITKISANASTGTALNAYWILSKALRTAKNEGLNRDNPCERVTPPKAVRESRGSHEVDDVKRILTYLAENGDPDLASRWCLSLFTGARQAECLGLEWERVNFDTGIVDYSWTLQWLPLKARYGRQTAEINDYSRELFDVDPGFDFQPVWRTACLIPPKTERSRRIVPMVGPLKAALAMHREQSDDRLVWVRDGGRPWPKGDDAKRWHDTLTAAGVPDLTLHSARHTVGTLLQQGGVPEAVRMAILGHSTVAMARNYAHVDQALTREALGVLETMLELPTAADAAGKMVD